MNRPLVIAIIFGVSVVAFFLMKKASWEGRFILLAAVASLVAYFRLYHYLLLLVSLSMFTFVGIALLWAWIASTRLRLSREIKNEAMVGESVPLKYRIETGSFLPLFHIRIWDRIFRERSDNTHEELSFEEPGYIGLLRLQRRERQDGSLHFIPPVRGVLKLGPIAVEGGDPFGIFTLTQWISTGDECLVLPSWVIMTGMPSIPARLGAREQEHLVSREGHSHEFLGTRPYTDGDSLRGVHWPLTARHDTLIVRQFQKEVEEEVLIVLDADRNADVGEGAENALEYLIALSLSLANAASGLGRPWNLVIVDTDIITIAHNSRNPLLQAQHALAKLHAKRETPIEDCLDDVRADFSNAACILLTARTDFAPAQALSRGDAKISDGARSLLIRVDPSTFAGISEGGIRDLKRRRQAGDAPRQTVHPGQHHVSEITISRGDNIEDLFLDPAFG